MFKNFLERKIGQPLSDEEFKEIKMMLNDDIQFNFKGFGKKPSYSEVIVIAVRCAIVLKRCSQIGV